MAEILVAFSVFSKQRVAEAIGASDFGADVGAEAGLFRGHVKARSAGDVVGIEDGQGREVEPGRAGDQFFGYGGAFEEAEGATRVKFDIGASHRCLRGTNDGWAHGRCGKGRWIK